MFRDANAALRFAFRTLGVPICKMSSVNSMRTPTSVCDMTPHERHAQAAIIISLIEKAVDPAGLAWILAHHNRELRGGERESGVLAVLVKASMAALPTGMHSTRGIGKLVRIYFGQEIGMAAVRADLRVRHERANEYKLAVHDALDVIGRRAEDAAHRALEGAGLIGFENVAAQAA